MERTLPGCLQRNSQRGARRKGCRGRQRPGTGRLGPTHSPAFPEVGAPSPLHRGANGGSGKVTQATVPFSRVSSPCSLCLCDKHGHRLSAPGSPARSPGCQEAAPGTWSRLEGLPGAPHRQLPPEAGPSFQGTREAGLLWLRGPRGPPPRLGRVHVSWQECPLRWAGGLGAGNAQSQDPDPRRWPPCRHRCQSRDEGLGWASGFLLGFEPVSPARGPRASARSHPGDSGGNEYLVSRDVPGCAVISYDVP